MKYENNMYQVISEALDHLFAAQFLSIHDHNIFIDAGQVALEFS